MLGGRKILSKIIREGKRTEERSYKWEEYLIAKMATWNNQTKNTSVFLNTLRHGKATLLSDLANFTFNDVVFSDGTILKNVTFDQLVEQVWTNLSKNTSTFTNATKN